MNQSDCFGKALKPWPIFVDHFKRLGHIPPVEAEKAYYASSANNDLAA
nr:hypothetical protein 49p1_00260 [Yersinia frederiksenii]